MTASEVTKLVAVVNLLWPHSRIGDDLQGTVAVWQEMLGDQSYSDAEKAIQGIAASGRNQAPPVGVVLATIIDRSTRLPDWDQVETEVLRMIRSYRPKRDRAMRDPYAQPLPEDWSHPVIAEYMTSDKWREWREGKPGDRTLVAQLRESYKATAERHIRNARNAAIGIPHPVPEIPRGGGLIRMDPTRHLPAAMAAEDAA